MRLLSMILLLLEMICRPGTAECQNARIMFYNTENLFDPFNDSLTKDDEYTPESDKHWTYGRFLNKAMGIYRVIAAAGEWEAPAIVGLCEIENRYALEALLNRTPLGKAGYRFIHKDSPDPRGIDVAMLYRADVFMPDTFSFLPVKCKDVEGKTREILYARGRLFGEREIHLFFNHWPSRAGGEGSAGKRLMVAEMLRTRIDSILEIDSLAVIIALGDFNDEPWDASMRTVAQSPPQEDQQPVSSMINLTERGRGFRNSGTIYHGGYWQLFDQVLVSVGLWNGEHGIALTVKKAVIVDPSFILTSGAGWNSTRPYRTYLGPFYQGGYSDHLPVYLDLTRIPGP